MAVLDDNGVPIPDIANSSLEYLDGKHRQYLESGDPDHLLTGAIVHVHNPRPVGGEGPDVTVFRIGGETLDEAVKTVIGVFDGFHGHQPPKWVASDNEDLANVLAEHYGAKVKPLTKESR